MSRIKSWIFWVLLSMRLCFFPFKNTEIALAGYQPFEFGCCCRQLFRPQKCTISGRVMKRNYIFDSFEFPMRLLAVTKVRAWFVLLLDT